MGSQQVKKNISIFFRLLTTRLSKELNNWPLLEFFGSGCYFLLHLVSYNLIVDRFVIPGWTKPELMVNLFIFEIYTYLLFFTFWRGLVHTVRDIGKGSFDYYLLKPISVRLLTFIRGGSLHNLLMIIAGLVGLVVASSPLRDNISPMSVLASILLLLVSMWFFHCLSVLFISLNFRYGPVESTASAPLHFQESMKYPGSLYNKSGLIVSLIVLPFSLLVNLPTIILLNKPVTERDLFVFVTMTVLVTVFSSLVWSKSIRHYASAN